MFWLRSIADYLTGRRAPAAVHESILPPRGPDPLRPMSAAEIAHHVVEALRDGDMKYIITKDLDNTALAWCRMNGVEPVHRLRLREAVQCVAGVTYRKMSIRAGGALEGVRLRLIHYDLKPDQARVYEIAMPVIRHVNGPGPAPSRYGPVLNEIRTGQTDKKPIAYWNKAGSRAA